MGTVYLAEDRYNKNASCVVKQLINNSDEGERAEAIRLFRREVAILRTLNHPGIVRVFDEHASEDGRYFLVMDYVPGRNLETVITSTGALTSEITVRIGIHCCDILEYLHTFDPPIIYRDLKPSNLMLTPDGRIVFIDFGIARAFMPKDVATRVVTAGYSPPEQYFGKPETRSDIYALGATLSHLCTGVRPKPLTSSMPLQHKPDVMLSLDALIRKMTAHNIEERPPSAQAVRYALFKIYKEVHAEFEIPDLPDNDMWDERYQVEEAARLKFGRGQGPRVSDKSGPSVAVKREAGSSPPGGHTHTDRATNSGTNKGASAQNGDSERQTLVQKVKRWFEGILHAP